MASNPPQHLNSITTTFVDQPPSCLEFSTTHPDHFIVGTYLLSETKDDSGNIEQRKTGSVQLWRLDRDTFSLYESHTESNGMNQSIKLTYSRSLVQKIPLPYAVFDLHFHPTNKDLFAIASSTGAISLFQVLSPSSDDESSNPEIKQLWTFPVREDPSIPALFFAWASDWFLDNREGFAVSFSDSETAVFGTGPGKDITEVRNLRKLGSFQARQAIEVWFVALQVYVGEGVGASGLVPYLFTGNDFGSLHTRRFDSSLPDASRDDDKDDEDEENPVLPSVILDQDDRGRHHSAGVTSILPLLVYNHKDTPIVLTGSYDEYLRIYDATMKGKVLAEVCLGGGVWRLQIVRKEESSVESQFWVLASCMHAGTRVVKVTYGEDREGDKWEMEVLAGFTEHESMNYASDTWKGNTQGDLACVSSSFYDRRLCFWRLGF